MLVLAATAVAAWVLLSTLAVGHAITVTPTDAGGRLENQRLALSIEAAVALPILVLVGSVARVSASLRDRRLGNLRLLGMSSAGTRVVAAIEAGTAATVGVAAGVVVYSLTRSTLTVFSTGGQAWSSSTLHPEVVEWVLVVAGVPLLVAAAAALPARGRSTAALDRVRRARTTRPSPWWGLPLLVGIALCALQLIAQHPEPRADWFVLFFAGCIFSGIGVVLVAPWMVRGLADLLVHCAPGPATQIAGRRLQAQPGGVVRVVSALMVGLFLVTGAISVVVVFEDTTQYQDAAAAIHHAQRVPVDVSAAKAAALTARARSVSGVSDVLLLPVLSAQGHATFPNGGGRFRQDHARVLVATCAQLLRLQPQLHGCTDRPMVIDGLPYSGEMSVHHAGRVVAKFPAPARTLTGPNSRSGSGLLDPLAVAVVIPPDTPGIRSILADAPRTGEVIGTPGRDLAPRLAAAHVFVQSEADFAYYDFISTLRTIVWTVAAVVLSIGLLTLALGGIDRAMARRRELASLQVLGTPVSVLCRAQFLEAAVPSIVGAMLAIATGLLAGATYLNLAGANDSDIAHLPWIATLRFAAIALTAALVLAIATTITTNPRLTSAAIHRE